MVLAPGSQLTVTVGAILSGAAVAVLVYLLSWRAALTGSAGAQGFRLIIVGIAISAMLASVTTWILVDPTAGTPVVVPVGRRAVSRQA